LVIGVAVISVSILEAVDAGVELLLAEAYQIPQFFSEPTSQGNVLMSIPDDATDHLITVSDLGIASGTTESLHDLRTGGNYTVTTTGNLKLAVQVTSGSATIQFKVWKSTTIDSATGTTVYNFTNTTLLNANDLFTTPILEFSVTAADLINVEAIGGNISAVKAWIVEIP